MRSPQPRVATLVVCTPDGDVVGSLPPLRADLPWWQDTTALVRGARERDGVELIVLRLLDAALPAAPGGEVTYVVELAGAMPDNLQLRPWPGCLEDHPLRLPYARPGGPDRALAWASERLSDEGLAQAGRPEQMRTWNLSTLWRIPLDSGDVWLKCVPPFFAHEASILRMLADHPVPRLLAAADGRILMPEIPGVDLYDANGPVLLSLIDILVRIQASCVGRVEELIGLGLPDWRGPSLADAIGSVVRRNAHDLLDDDRHTLDDFVARLPARFDRIGECGIPDTIVHGDFAPGNARGDGERLTLLDWGDCGVGHPMLDAAAFFDRTPREEHDELRAHWESRWRIAVPGSDATRAAELLAPVAAARMAVIFQNFLDRIEPSEHPYHRADPADWLHRTADIARGT